MTDIPEDIPDRTRKVWAALAEQGPATKETLGEQTGLSPRTAQKYIEAIRKVGYDIRPDDEYRYSLPGDGPSVDEFEWGVAGDDTDADAPTVDLDVEQTATDPNPDDLTNRERVIVSELQTGTTVDELADELNEREPIITEHLRELRRQGWQVYIDETADHVTIEGDHTLRSSEHTGTRTRKANRWWESRHNSLVRAYKALDTPDADLAATDSHEDWVLHLTDLHAGDRVRRDDGTVIYETEDIPAVIDHVTERTVALADKHGSDYDACHVCWGGDMVTNEGIYEGQFEDLDAWLDEQHETLHEPLIRQLKALAERFPAVNVVCQVGNHGDHRASGTSKQANADLILYKAIRNTVAHLQEHADLLGNVRFRIGEATPFRNFPLRGGRLRGHLRHGQHRRPQAETSARKKEWLSTLRSHEFDVALMGHHHISGRIPWDGPPILATASPKPAGEFVESLGERVDGGEQDLATVFGVADEGLTAVFPVDTRDFDA